MSETPTNTEPAQELDDNIESKPAPQLPSPDDNSDAEAPESPISGDDESTNIDVPSPAPTSDTLSPVPEVNSRTGSAPKFNFAPTKRIVVPKIPVEEPRRVYSPVLSEDGDEAEYATYFGDVKGQAGIIKAIELAVEENMDKAKERQEDFLQRSTRAQIRLQKVLEQREERMEIEAAQRAKRGQRRHRGKNKSLQEELDAMLQEEDDTPKFTLDNLFWK